MGNPDTLVTLGTQDTGQRLEKTQGQIKNGQPRDTGNTGYTRHRTKTNKTHNISLFNNYIVHDPLHILKYQQFTLNRHTHVHI